MAARARSIYLRARERANASPDECVVILKGDTAINCANRVVDTLQLYIRTQSAWVLHIMALVGHPDDRALDYKAKLADIQAWSTSGQACNGFDLTWKLDMSNVATLSIYRSSYQLMCAALRAIDEHLALDVHFLAESTRSYGNISVFVLAKLYLEQARGLAHSCMRHPTSEHKMAQNRRTAFPILAAYAGGNNADTRQSPCTGGTAQRPCNKLTPSDATLQSHSDIIQEKLALAITVFDYARVTLMADGHMDPPYSIHAL